MRLASITRTITSVMVAVSAVLLIAVAAGQALDVWRFVPVLSGSMSGYIEAGDVAVMRPMGARDLQAGEVIAFNAPTPGAPLTLHRVVEVVESGDRPLIRTKGDANDVADPWTARLEDRTVWAASWKIPNLGLPVLWLQQIHIRLILLLMAGALLARVGVAAIWDRPESAERDDETPSTSDDEPKRHLALSRGANAVVAATTAVAALGAMAVADQSAPAAAAFVSSTSASQRVASWTATEVGSPTDLKASVACTDGRITGVSLAWQLPTTGTPPTEISIRRGAVSGGPYSEIARVSGRDTTYLDPATDVAGSLGLYYVVVGVSGVDESTLSNEAFTLAVCDSVVTPTTLPSRPTTSTIDTTPTTVVDTTTTTIDVPPITVVDTPTSTIPPGSGLLDPLVGEL